MVACIRNLRDEGVAQREWLVKGSPTCEKVVKKMLLLYTLGAGALIALPIFFLRVLKQEKFPRSRIDEFISRANAGPVAHRGGKPENTLAAFRIAKSQGASGVEVDMRFSKDDHPVLIHDSTVDRTSNGCGRVCDLTLEELKTLDFGIKAGTDFAGERIPTLSEALSLCEDLGLVMFLELKGDPNKSAKVIKSVFSEHPSLYERVAVISFYPDIVYKLRRADSNLVLGLVHRVGFIAYTPNGERRNSEIWKHVLYVLSDGLLRWSIGTWLWRVLGISLLLVNKNDVLKGRVPMEAWESRDVSLVAWTVNELEEKDHFENELKMPYFTDYVSRMDSVEERGGD